jgi:uncharacterized membrane protein YbaN (DUF454 family)|tara:strand:- start:1598 stop:2020 length:423 start_codon:yes stop_codon:yes gene_type:complete
LFEKKHSVFLSSNLFIRGLWLIGGLFLTAIGLIGIIVPGLPTTIFMILAAACYFKSSQVLYNWVINQKYFGMHVKNYREGKGMPVKAKLISISCMWGFVVFALFFALAQKNFFIHIIIIISAVIGSKMIFNLPNSDPLKK